MRVIMLVSLSLTNFSQQDTLQVLPGSRKFDFLFLWPNNISLCLCISSLMQ